MIVVQTYKKNAGEFSDLTSAIDFKDCKKRLRLYFSNVEEVKRKLLAGGKISIPYLTLQKDRRCRVSKVKDERRRPIGKTIITRNRG